MPYTPPATYTTGGNFTAANGNNLEAGMVGAYNQLESITANDGIAAPNNDGPKTLATFISEIARQLRLIIGGADWFTAPPTSLTGLNTNKANLSGATFTGTVNVSSGSLQRGGADVVVRASGGGFANYDIGVGPIGSRPAAGSKGRVYIETPFS